VSLTRVSSLGFSCIACVSRRWVFWITKIMRNATIVVPVITSCQVRISRRSAQGRTLHTTLGTRGGVVRGGCRCAPPRSCNIWSSARCRCANRAAAARLRENLCRRRRSNKFRHSAGRDRRQSAHRASRISSRHARRQYASAPDVQQGCSHRAHRAPARDRRQRAGAR